jgi:hypothetical protein
VNKATQFEMLDGIAIFRPSGHASLEQAISLVKSAIGAARDCGVRKLLIAASELEGFESPGIGARHYMARQWAGISAGMLHIAVVPRADMIDPEKFGILVARNFGASADVFASETDAIAWLRSKC